MKTAISTLLTAAVATLLLAGPVSAHEFKLGELRLDHPWARASAGPARSGAAFLTIHNGGAADRLVAASGDVAERVELHTHLMAGDVMKMRQVESIEVPAGGMAELQPGGFHIMLIGLKAPLKEGDRFPLTLTFEQAGEVTVEVAVESVASMGSAGAAGGMNHGGMGHGNMPPSN